MGEVSTWLFGIKELLTAIVAIVGAIGVIYGWVIRPFKKQAELDREQTKKIDRIVECIEDLRRQVDNNQAEYVRDRLQTLHEKYVNELGWASPEEKRRVVDWYETYKRKGYNHLADTYADDIIHLPERPQK